MTTITLSNLAYKMQQGAAFEHAPINFVAPTRLFLGRTSFFLYGEYELGSPFTNILARRPISTSLLDRNRRNAGAAEPRTCPVGATRAVLGWTRINRAGTTALPPIIQRVEKAYVITAARKVVGLDERVLAPMSCTKMFNEFERAPRLSAPKPRADLGSAPDLQIAMYRKVKTVEGRTGSKNASPYHAPADDDEQRYTLAVPRPGHPPGGGGCGVETGPGVHRFSIDSVIDFSPWYRGLSSVLRRVNSCNPLWVRLGFYTIAHSYAVYPSHRTDCLPPLANSRRNTTVYSTIVRDCLRMYTSRMSTVETEMDRRKDLDRSKSLALIHPHGRAVLIITRDAAEFIRVNYGMKVRVSDSVVDLNDQASVQEFAKAHDPGWALYRDSNKALTSSVRERWLDQLFQPRRDSNISWEEDSSGIRVFHYGRCYWCPPGFSYFVEMPYRQTEKEKAMDPPPGPLILRLRRWVEIYARAR